MTKVGGISKHNGAMPRPTGYVPVQVSDAQFEKISSLLYSWTGIGLSDKKKPMVTGRLAKRLRSLGYSDLGPYIKLIQDDELERLHFINALSTNETWFFREKIHFDILESEIKHRRLPLRLWSAASSKGHEALSMAMLCHEPTQGHYSILATDINTDVLKYASRGLYPIDAAQSIPEVYLRKFCRKGTGQLEGYFWFDDHLTQNIKLARFNLLDNPNFQPFDFIFLRNVLIYFPKSVRHTVIGNVCRVLKPGGFLVLGSSESILEPACFGLEPVSAAVFKKVHRND